MSDNTAQPRLEDQIRHACSVRHYSLATERSYVGWYRQVVRWAGLKHPATSGKPAALFVSRSQGRCAAFVVHARKLLRLQHPGTERIVNERASRRATDLQQRPVDRQLQGSRS